MRRGGWLGLVLAVLPAAVPAGGGEGDFEPVLQRFRQALAARDGAALADLTRLPFLFEGRPRDRAGFMRVAPRLFDAPTTRCLLAVRPVVEGADRVLSCRPYAFYFRRGPDGAYRLEEFSADGEDAP
jgi:hypothetical protein